MPSVLDGSILQQNFSWKLLENIYKIFIAISQLMFSLMSGIMSRRLGVSVLPAKVNEMRNIGHRDI